MQDMWNAPYTMGDVLPLGTLRNVKNLSLWLCHGRVPQWPDSWNQLTNMTRLDLSCHIQDTFKGNPHALIPLRIRSLIEVKVAVPFESFDISGEEYLVLLIGSLPVLSRLQDQR